LAYRFRRSKTRKLRLIKAEQQKENERLQAIEMEKRFDEE